MLPLAADAAAASCALLAIYATLRDAADTACQPCYAANITLILPLYIRYDSRCHYAPALRCLRLRPVTQDIDADKAIRRYASDDTPPRLRRVTLRRYAAAAGVAAASPFRRRATADSAAGADAAYAVLMPPLPMPLMPRR